jgi:hypothetical protein
MSELIILTANEALGLTKQTSYLTVDLSSPFVSTKCKILNYCAQYCLWFIFSPVAHVKVFRNTIRISHRRHVYYFEHQNISEESLLIFCMFPVLVPVMSAQLEGWVHYTQHTVTAQVSVLDTELTKGNRLLVTIGHSE